MNLLAAVYISASHQSRWRKKAFSLQRVGKKIEKAPLRDRLIIAPRERGHYPTAALG